MKTVLEKIIHTLTNDWSSPQPYIDLVEGYLEEEKQQMLTVSPWVKASERLPNNGETVIVYLAEPVNHTKLHFTIYSDRYGFESVPARLVTHWQIPQTP